MIKIIKILMIFIFAALIIGGLIAGDFDLIRIEASTL